jgi:DNA mismatch repair ATPase MutS
MKAFLTSRNQDFDLQRELPWNEQPLTQDLELNTFFNAMALGDKFLLEVARKAVLSGLNDPDTILYRQNILKDCLINPSIVREIYDIAVEAIENKKQHYYGFYSSYPGSRLSGSREMLQMFVGLLKKLKKIAENQADKFESEGFARFFTMIRKELDDEYFASIEDHLKELKFRDGVLVSAELGKGNEGANYILRRSQRENRTWIGRIFAKKPPVFTYSIHPRDEVGGRYLSDLKDRGINLVANALAQSADHIDSFFNLLRIELAFYIGCLNLHEQLARMGEPVCFPLPVAPHERRHSFRGLYDLCLALTMKQKIAGNEVNADRKGLVIITGANQGGKSTFLRSIGLAQLMMQCGMFVAAESFCSNVCDGLFTHYKREEDAAMRSGKLDEELSRMSDIVSNIRPDSMVLFNESFAATNEREGSEIARQIICGLLERGIKIFFVTHLFEFPQGFHVKHMKNAIFLRAERRADGKRTFRLVEGGPLQTSYGEDVYNRIFGTGDQVIKDSLRIHTIRDKEKQQC